MLMARESEGKCHHMVRLLADGRRGVDIRGEAGGFVSQAGRFECP